MAEHEASALAVEHIRPWQEAYKWGDHERAAAVLKEMRQERYAGLDEAGAAEAMWAATVNDHGSEGVDLPPCLIEAIEYPAVGFEEHIVALAQAFGLSPGTLLDHVLIRSAGLLNEQGDPDDS